MDYDVSISVLVVGYVAVAAADLAGVGVSLEGEGLSGLEEGAGVGVDVEFVEEDGGGQEEGGLEVEVSGEVLRDHSFVHLGENGDRRSVAHQFLEFAVVGDVHEIIIMRAGGGGVYRESWIKIGWNHEVFLFLEPSLCMEEAFLLESLEASQCFLGSMCFACRVDLCAFSVSGRSLDLETSFLRSALFLSWERVRMEDLAGFSLDLDFGLLSLLVWCDPLLE